MSFLATDQKKSNLNLSKAQSIDVTLPSVEKSLELPKVAKSNIVFVAHHPQEGELKKDVQKLISETKSEDIGTKKDPALSLLKDKVKALRDQEPNRAIKIDDDLKSRLDALTESIQNGGSFNEIKNFQDREQGLVPQTQVKALHALLEVVDRLGDLKIAKNAKTMSPIYEKIADMLEPGTHAQLRSTTQQDLAHKINELNNSVNEGKILSEILKANPGKSFRMTETNTDTLELMVLTAEKVSAQLPKSKDSNDRNTLMEPFLSKIGESLLNK